MSRNRIIAMDFAAGVPVDELMAREKINRSRVYQIVNKVYDLVGARMGCTKEELGVLIQRRRATWEDGWPSNTPEEFYWTELHRKGE
jgi:hypothetical protein